MYYSKERGSDELGIKFDNEHVHCSINYTTILEMSWISAWKLSWNLEFEMEFAMDFGLDIKLELNY